jgi:hypothetical protein
LFCMKVSIISVSLILLIAMLQICHAWWRQAQQQTNSNDRATNANTTLQPQCVQTTMHQQPWSRHRTRPIIDPTLWQTRHTHCHITHCRLIQPTTTHTSCDRKQWLNGHPTALTRVQKEEREGREEERERVEEPKVGALANPPTPLNDESSQDSGNKSRRRQQQQHE